MDNLTLFFILALASIVLLYIWIIWTASSNGRSALIWFILTFFISPWLVAFLLLIAGESSTHKELRELKQTVSPENSDAIQSNRDRDNYNRLILGLLTLVLHIVAIAILF